LKFALLLLVGNSTQSSNLKMVSAEHPNSGKDAIKCGSEKCLSGRCTMPHYVFVCRDCNKEFERTLHISELGKTPVKCPNCGSQKTEQKAAAFAAVTSKKS
jgi:putative FmdB family regulatory protein